MIGLTKDQAADVAKILNRDEDLGRTYQATNDPSWGADGWYVTCTKGVVTTLLSIENVPVGRHTGLTMLLDTEQGFHAANGTDSFGYHDTIEELKEEIDDYWKGSEHGPLNGCFA